MVTVVVCAFIDDQLLEMFKRELPESVPGKRADLWSGFGPLSRLSSRIQIAHALGWVSQDLLVEANELRGMRNDISHRWDISELRRALDDFIGKKMSPVEEHLDNGITLPKNFYKSMNAFDRFRVRLI